MALTKPDLDQQATDTEDWLDSLDPDDTPSRDGRHLLAIGAALTALEQAQANLDQTVARAHAAGDSGGAIGMVLGTSKQNAHRKFAHIPVDDDAAWLKAETHAAAHVLRVYEVEQQATMQSGMPLRLGVEMQSAVLLGLDAELIADRLGAT